MAPIWLNIRTYSVFFELIFYIFMDASGLTFGGQRLPKWCQRVSPDTLGHAICMRIVVFCEGPPLYENQPKISPRRCPRGTLGKFRVSFWSPLGLILSTFGLTFLTLSVYLKGSDANLFQESAFQVVSIATTTGFLTANYSNWPLFVPILLLTAAFIGACAGSTGGGIKVIRALVLAKQSAGEITKLIHPNAVVSIKLGKKAVNSRVAESVWGFFSIYIIVFIILFMFLLAQGNDFITSFSAVGATLNNLGPGLGDVSTNYQALSNYSKGSLCVAMLLGRLEIFTLLVLFTPAFWRK